MTKFSEKNLIKAGYKKSTVGTIFNKSDFIYQKAVFNKNKTARIYFINVYQYLNLHGDVRHGFMPGGQFYQTSDHTRWFDIKLGGYKTIEETEDAFRQFYEQLYCFPYEKFCGF